MIIMPTKVNLPMIKIRRIQPDEAAVAKQLIYRVAHQVFHDIRPLEESIAFYEARALLHDVDELQQTYFDNDGIFLVMTDHDRIIGTGAIRKIDHEICELKRVWLLFEYHGQGLGYRMMQDLLSFARAKGYVRMRLETDQMHQNRAFNFYKRLGFYEIPRYSDNDEDVAMEMIL
ncbi:MAG: GNAT family N-acetyltransferase [Chloroflexi bacterium]|nr:MAG: GNAT family N-acetyltransferase [Chloroflexota bacterium]